MKISGQIDGQNVSQLAKDTLFKFGTVTQEISGRKLFASGPTFNQNINLKGLSDGVNLSAVDPVTLEGPQNISVQLEFSQSLRVSDNLSVKGKISDLNIRKLQEEIVTKDGQQSLTGNLHLKENLLVEKDVLVNGTVNAVDLSELKKEDSRIVELTRDKKKRFDFGRQKYCGATKFLEKSFKGM